LHLSLAVCSWVTFEVKDEKKIRMKQSSQVDLLAKSEIFDSVAVVCDTSGPPCQGVWGHVPPGNFENWKL